jgi:hypothetical protein
MGQFLKKRSGDFLKITFFNLGGVLKRFQEKVEMRSFMSNFRPKKYPFSRFF